MALWSKTLASLPNALKLGGSFDGMNWFCGNEGPFKWKYWIKLHATGIESKFLNWIQVHWLESEFNSIEKKLDTNWWSCRYLHYQTNVNYCYTWWVMFGGYYWLPLYTTIMFTCKLCTFLLFKQCHGFNSHNVSYWINRHL
jgi:hypothetical protein